MTTLITQALAKIAEMEQRAEKATPDVCVADGSPKHFCEDGATLMAHVDDREARRVLARFNQHYDSRFNDALFYAKARTELPALCAIAKILIARLPEEWIEMPEEYTAALKAFVEGK